MMESVKVGGLFWGMIGEGYVVRWRRVKMGCEDYPKGGQLSPLNKLSNELSCGFSGRMVADL